METTVTALFILGILTNLLKGADLFLRQHQKKWIQAKAESLTLWLEYTRPVAWYAKLTSKKGKYVLISIIAILVISIFVLEDTPIARDVLFYTTLFVPLILYLLLSLFFLRRHLIKAVDWLFGDGSFRSSCRRVFILFLITFLIFIAFFALLFSIVWLTEDASPSTKLVIRVVGGGLGVLIFLPLGIITMELWLLGWSLIYITFLLKLFEYIFKLTRAIAWRVVEYDKGSYAALTLIFTMVLGVWLALIKRN